MKRTKPKSIKVTSSHTPPETLHTEWTVFAELDFKAVFEHQNRDEL